MYFISTEDFYVFLAKSCKSTSCLKYKLGSFYHKWILSNILDAMI